MAINDTRRGVRRGLRRLRRGRGRRDRRGGPRGGRAPAAALRHPRQRRVGRRPAVRRRDRRLRGALRDREPQGCSPSRARRRPRGARHRADGPPPASQAAGAGGRQREGTLGDPALDAAARARRARRCCGRRALGAARRLFIDVMAPPRGCSSSAPSSTPPTSRRWRAHRLAALRHRPRTRFATRERFPDAEDVIAAWPAASSSSGDRPRDLSRRADARPQARRRAPYDRAALRGRLIGAMGPPGRRPSAASGCWPPGIDRRGARPRSALRSGSTSARTPPRRPRVSIMAELVAVRHGRSGARLSDHDGAIRRGAGPGPARRGSLSSTLRCRCRRSSSW